VLAGVAGAGMAGGITVGREGAAYDPERTLTHTSG